MLNRADLDLVLDATRDLWPQFAGKRLFITGGTGFVGKWLVETFQHANKELALGASVTAIGWPLRWPNGHWDALIHAAPVAVKIPPQFDHALLVSSGAAYEQQTEYACMKRAAELLAVKRAAIARLFCFVGPYLCDRYAIQTFINNAVKGKPLRVTGGSIRSYMYAADMAAWLWRILFTGKPGKVYDVGGDKPVSLPFVALTVAEKFTPEPEVIIDVTESPSYYLPKLTSELGLAQSVTLDGAIERTIEYAKTH